MNLPNVIRELVKTQNNHDSASYANCFSETAVVVDEGKTYNGKSEIKNWVNKANESINPVMKPLKYRELEKEAVLLAEISGDFDGSPVVLKFYHTIENGLLQRLKITA
jgi:hypothetical protein